jgi:potassium/hydrogen antiporter
VPVALEITSLRHIEGDIVDFTVTESPVPPGAASGTWHLPGGSVVAPITRDNEIIPPRGSTQIQSGDHVFVVLRPETRSLVNRVFGSRVATDVPVPLPTEFPLQGTATVDDLREFYGIELEAPADATLDQILRDRLRGEPEEDDVVRVGMVCLRVREMTEDRIEWVGLSIAEEA